MHLRAGAEARIYLVTANQQLGEVWANSTPCTHTSRYFSSPARNDALNLCSTPRHTATVVTTVGGPLASPGPLARPPPVGSCLSQTHSRISLQHPSIYLRYSSSSSSTPTPPQRWFDFPLFFLHTFFTTLSHTCNFPFFFLFTHSLPVRPPSSRHPRPTDIISVRPAPGVPCSDLATRHQGNLRFSALLSPSRFALRAL
jgi:hypothetical protein